MEERHEGPATPWAEGMRVPLVSLNGEVFDPFPDGQTGDRRNSRGERRHTAPPGQLQARDKGAERRKDGDDDDEEEEDVPLLGPSPSEYAPFSVDRERRPTGFAAVGAFFTRVLRMRRAARLRIEERKRQEVVEPPRLSHLDRMTLSPWIKFRRFGRVPAKFILALGVVVSLTAFYVAKNIQSSDYLDGTTDTLRFLLGNAEDSGRGTTTTGGTVLYTAKDLHEHLNRTVTSYFLFPNASVTRYEVDDTVRMVYTNRSGDYVTYVTRERPLGPMQELEGPALSVWLQKHFSVALHYNLISRQLSAKDDGALMDVRYAWKCRGMLWRMTAGGAGE